MTAEKIVPLTARSVMEAMEQGGLPENEGHEIIGTLPWRERSVFAWACDCHRCKRATAKNGAWLRREGEAV